MFPQTPQPVTNENIEKIIDTFCDKVVINCVLTKNNIASGQDLLDYLYYYEKLGAKRFNFTEIMFDTTLSAQNKALSEYYQENRVVIEDLSKDLDELGILKIAENGDEYKTIEHSYKDKTTVLSRVDMSKIAYKQQNDNTYSKFLIYPSGEIGVHSIENR